MTKVGRKIPKNSEDAPTDHLIVSLRTYVTRPSKAKAGGKDKGGKYAPPHPGHHPSATEWVLIFDCETFTTPDQSLRFGNYQLRLKGELIERGIFYQPGSIAAGELATTKRTLAEEELAEPGPPFQILTRHEFVEQVLFQKGQKLGANIVGFNLPFDISRLAVRHTEARRSMKGGFSFVLIDDKKWPTISVRHISQRMSFIHFTGIRPKKPKPGREENPKDILDPEAANVDRGYFVDVKTLAAALLSESHSLASLSELLKIPHPKEESDDHGKVITPPYIRYALRDVQATWECFDALCKYLESLRLTATNPSALYSEASLGKSYLRTMGIEPWREADCDPVSTGRIMSTYFGGRSEVHIRRTVVRVIHSDFLSMYPTVCTLMGLWKFVIADGFKEIDATAAIRTFVAEATAARMQAKDSWGSLHAIVQVLPEKDLFPVRARYGAEEQATIGLNYLTSDKPMWFTLADVLVSKILTGKTPKILKAFRFLPGPAQNNLKPIMVATRTIDPAQGDFYKSLIMQRLDLGDYLDTATEAEKPRIEATRQAIKILANSTSYGIFVELNVNNRNKATNLNAFGVRGRVSRVASEKVEEPGRYFHPLLGTLITGAARLMLALAERQVHDQGLNWAFCDTDSMAIANTDNLPAHEFKEKALRVQNWFADLNPYGRTASILQLEKVNFPVKAKQIADALIPPECLAISAKRYVLFNRDSENRPIIRKASGHGLGYLSAPYDEPAELRRKRIKQIGVPLWQEDVWKAIIEATDSKRPDEVAYSKLNNFSTPAASRYAATSLELLAWFDGYNGIGKGVTPKPYAQQVKPFNFLLSLQAKSRVEMAQGDMAALRANPLWQRREPTPVAPFRKKVAEAVREAFDRGRPETTKIPVKWLKTYARSLSRYHLHPEAKFIGGNYDERGFLVRRHVHALAFQQIGKEADNLDEREYVGEDDDHIEYQVGSADRKSISKYLTATQKEYAISDREIWKAARISHHTLSDAKRGRKIDASATRRLVSALTSLRNRFEKARSETSELIAWAQDAIVALGGRNEFARQLDIDAAYLGRVLSGQKPPSNELLQKLRELKNGSRKEAFQAFLGISQ